MIKKCLGCGITLQDRDSKKVGYTPDIKKDLCLRCFKLKNYNILTDKGINIDNDDILAKINKKNCFVMFLIDFLNIDGEVIDTYKKIKNEKILVLTKSDIIPKNIKINDLINNIKRVYNIHEEIIVCSSKNKKNMSVLTNICMSHQKVLMAGFTNAGKSSLINALVGSDITVSKRSNTTQDFIELNVDGIRIIDAPGFISEISNERKIPKNTIKPISYQLKNIYYLLIDDIKLNIKNDSNLVVYLNNEIEILKRREKETVNCNILVPHNSDLIIKGLGFIKFMKDTYININTKDYEIRPSIIGGRHE